MDPSSKKIQYKKIGHYILETIIGKGSFSLVYRGINEVTNDFVAIKVTLKETINKQPQLRHLIQSEVNILHQCFNENVVQLIDYIETNISCYLIMEYCNEGDLRNYINSKDHLSEAEAVDFLKQLLNGFKGLHEVNAIHRDFKSANVLKKNGKLKIGDLGFGKQTEMSNTCLGTSIYMAPEVLMNKTYTNKADIWSLGVVFYEMLFGTFPFIGKNDKEILTCIENNNLDLGKFNIKISENCQDLLRRIFEIDQDKRIEWIELYTHKLFEKGEKGDIAGIDLGSIIKTYNVHDLKRNSKEETSKMKMNKKFYKRLKEDGESVFKLEKIDKNEKTDYDNDEEDNENPEILSKVGLYSKKSNFMALDKKKEEIFKEDVLDSQHPNFSEVVKYVKNQEMADVLMGKIKKNAEFYMHQRNIYSYIGKTIFNSLILQANNADAQYANFILAKKLLLLNQRLLNSFDQNTNVFELENFDEFVNSNEGKQIKKFLSEENEYFGIFFTSMMEDTKRVLMEKNVLNNQFVKHLNKDPPLNDFDNLYQQILFDYYLALENKANLYETKENQHNALKLYKHCYEILDTLVIDDIFPFVLTDYKGNEIRFDFKKYFQIYEGLSVQEIKKSLEIKFENSLKNMNI